MAQGFPYAVGTAEKKKKNEEEEERVQSVSKWWISQSYSFLEPGVWEPVEEAPF